MRSKQAQVEHSSARETSERAIHYESELKRERAARERVAGDLKALIGFEAQAKFRLENDLAQEKAEGQAQRSGQYVCICVYMIT